jgi:hypothetical protein
MMARSAPKRLPNQRQSTPTFLLSANPSSGATSWPTLLISRKWDLRQQNMTKFTPNCLMNTLLKNTLTFLLQTNRAPGPLHGALAAQQA